MPVTPCIRCGMDPSVCRCVMEANENAEMERLTAELKQVTVDRDTWKARAHASEAAELTLKWCVTQLTTK